jgi:hypothetical protein
MTTFMFIAYAAASAWTSASQYVRIFSNPVFACTFLTRTHISNAGYGDKTIAKTPNMGTFTFITYKFADRLRIVRKVLGT